MIAKRQNKQSEAREKKIAASMPKLSINRNGAIITQKKTADRWILISF